MAPRLRLVLALLTLIGLFGCKAKPAPVTPPRNDTPAIYTGDRRGPGGLLGRQQGEIGERPAPAGVSGEQMVLGNPDGAQPSVRSRERYLIVRPQYALSYNDRLRYPNWVSWTLKQQDIGSIPRGNFAPDPDLPFNAVTPSDYTGSGYDRGHNCPSKDRSATEEDNRAVFYMTNMTPQLHAMNGGPWERLESYCRTLAKRGNTCYIICGHAGEQGRTRGGVSIPSWGWKVVIVAPEGQPITAASRAIAVKMPNDDPSIESDTWERFIVTIADLERALGWNLLSNLPESVAASLREKRDSGGGSFGGEDGGYVKRNPRRNRSGGGSFGR